MWQIPTLRGPINIVTSCNRARSKPRITDEQKSVSSHIDFKVIKVVIVWEGLNTQCCSSHWALFYTFPTDKDGKNLPLFALFSVTNSTFLKALRCVTSESSKQFGNGARISKCLCAISSFSLSLSSKPAVVWWETDFKKVVPRPMRVFSNRAHQPFAVFTSEPRIWFHLFSSLMVFFAFKVPPKNAILIICKNNIFSALPCDPWDIL